MRLCVLTTFPFRGRFCPGPFPPRALPRFNGVESEEAGLHSPTSVRSIKRLVRFSRKPLSSAAPNLESSLNQTFLDSPVLVVPAFLWFPQLGGGSFTQGTIQPFHVYSPCSGTPHTQQSMEASPSVKTFGLDGVAADKHVPCSQVSTSNPRLFALISFMSTILQSDSWHRIGWNFAFAYIQTYLVVASGQCLCSLFPALSSAGVTVS
jgi:hypothetical protein